MENKIKSLSLSVIEKSAILYLSIHMLIYGGGKSVQFRNTNISAKLLDELTGQELVWAFMGYSQVFPLVVGAIQVVGAVLVLIKKFRLLGCILLLPILINIILIDVLYHVSFGACLTAILCLICVFIILFINHQPLVNAINSLFLQNLQELLHNRYLVFFLAVFIFILIKMIEYQLVR